MRNTWHISWNRRGLTLEELKNHPEGMTGKNLYPPVTKSYEKEPFHTPSGKVEIRSLVLERYRESHGYSGLPEYPRFPGDYGCGQAQIPADPEYRKPEAPVFPFQTVPDALAYRYRGESLWWRSIRRTEKHMG